LARFTLLVPDFLAGDTEFEKYELHPGDELLCLGFPLGVQANEAGFPILRSGKIASYPLTPLKVVKHFLFDFKIYPGNSGGPVYFSYSGRTYGDTGRLGENLQYVVGLVTSSIGSLFFQGQEISVAQVVPAGFIVETINQLPELEK